MLLILLELSILPREKLMLSQRLMLSMDMDTTALDTATLVTATLDTATLGSQPTPDQLLLSPELPLQLFPDQLSLLSPEHLESGRERLRLSQRPMLTTDPMDTTTLDTATLESQPTLDQLSPELPLQLFPDQLSLLSPESPLQLSPDMLLQLFPDLSFLATPALADLEVFGKRHSLRTVTKTSKQKLNSNSIKFKICYVV